MIIAYDTLISGTNKADSINNALYYVSLNGGNDVIFGFNSTDSIQITAGSIKKCYADGDDAIVSVKGTNYSGIAGNDFICGQNSTIKGGAGNDTIIGDYNIKCNVIQFGAGLTRAAATIALFSLLRAM